MVGVTFFGNFDLASAAIWLFWLFFALLIFYIQRENMREGYPLEADEGGESPNQGPFPLPSPKTYKLPHGRGEVTVPSAENEAAHRRENLALAPTSKAAGSPFAPTGNPLLDGVGPASWVPRRDVPELDAHGHPKIVPMRTESKFHVSAGRDPRGLPVVDGKGEVVGEVNDMWIDEGEAMVRYLEYTLAPQYGGRKKLVPIQMAKIRGPWLKMMSPWVQVRSLVGNTFADVPETASPNQVTMLEEDKICAYYAGGTLYASPDRLMGNN